jgi:hexosaminidase
VIIPRPLEHVALPGEFPIGRQTAVSAGPGAERAASLLAGYLSPRSVALSAAPGGREAVVRMELGDVGLGPEGYELVVERDAVMLRASREAGLFHGVQTLRQLLPPETLDPGEADPSAWRWPCGVVRDAPRVGWRGVMLDVARHFMPLDFLYAFVDEIALHKFNVLHLHLTDDQGWRLEIPGRPRLTEVGAYRAESMVGRALSTEYDGVPHGGYYTGAELAALAAFAERRGVTIVPEIEMPGHARAALAAYPEFGNRPDVRLPVWTAWGISEDIFGVRDETLDFLRGVLDEVMALFPGRFIHIGGDECPTGQWERNPDALRRAASAGLAHPRELLGWFLREMGGFVESRGRRAVCWNDAENTGELDRGMVLTAWLEASQGATAVARGHQVIMAPHLSTYLDYRQSEHPGEPLGHPERILTLADAYEFDPLAGGLPAVLPDGGPGVLGTQAQLWTEFAPTPDHVRHLAYPRLCALAEAGWSAGVRDFDDFERRMVVHEQRLAALGALPRVAIGWRAAVSA